LRCIVAPLSPVALPAYCDARSVPARVRPRCRLGRPRSIMPPT